MGGGGGGGEGDGMFIGGGGALFDFGLGRRRSRFSRGRVTPSTSVWTVASLTSPSLLSAF